MSKKIKVLRLLIYISLLIIICEIVAYIILSATGVLDASKVASIVLAIITPALIFLWAVFLAWYSQTKSIYRQLYLDNKYYFGKPTFFYNSFVFQKVVRKKMRNRKAQGYIISFTACNFENNSSLVRNDIISDFNFCISEAITNKFTLNGKSEKNVCYCFDKNAFVIFVLGEDEEKINELIRYFEKTIYDIARENEIRLTVQPFFGITKYDRSSTVNENVENAHLARNNSERHFELATFFSNDLKFTFTAQETKEMIDALNNKEFVVYYQPKFNLNSKRFISSEALIRWNSPKYGLIPPARFIAKAEAAGLIHDLDTFVFQTVCKDLKDAKMKGKRLIPVSINFSLYEFYSPNFIQYLIETIDKHDIPRHLIEIEITETTTQVNSFLCISVIKKLRDEGIRILMDDFGVGYSNFNNLRKMPIDSIKIDKIFIDDIVSDAKTRNIVGFLISLGKVNGLEVIAEGVDNIEQVEILKRLKLDTIQGFFYSRPLPKKEYEQFLSSNTFECKGGM